MAQPITRTADWPDRLQSYLLSCRALPFAWGGFDCFCFAFGALEAITETSGLYPWRGRYDSPLSAARLAEADFGASWEDALDQHLTALGLQDRPLMQAVRGDLCAGSVGGSTCIGVINTEQAVFVTERDGLIGLPLSVVQKIWGVD